MIDKNSFTVYILNFELKGFSPFQSLTLSKITVELHTFRVNFLNKFVLTGEITLNVYDYTM